MRRINWFCSFMLIPTTNIFKSECLVLVILVRGGCNCLLIPRFMKHDKNELLFSLLFYFNQSQNILKVGHSKKPSEDTVHSCHLNLNSLAYWTYLKEDRKWNTLCFNDLTTEICRKVFKVKGHTLVNLV